MFLYLLIWLLSPLTVQGYNLLFVHLGTAPPPCLFSAIKQARFFNPHCPIYLLTQEAYFPISDRIKLSESDVLFIDIHSIPITEEHQLFLQKNRIDPSLTDGLWLYSLERFFYLFDFIQDRQLTDVVHLENDTMLYVDLQELMSKREQEGIAAPFQTSSSCIPCFVFIKNTECFSVLIHSILSDMQTYTGSHPHTSLNDMKTLANFYKKGGPLSPLPTLMPEYQKIHFLRPTLNQARDGMGLDFLSMNASLFPGFLFDAATLGIFINGKDPKRSPQSGPGTISHHSLFNPRHFLFFWGIDEQGRHVPCLRFQEKIYRIVNLHFHSKKVEDYTSYRKFRADFPSTGRIEP